MNRRTARFNSRSSGRHRPVRASKQLKTPEATLKESFEILVLEAKVNGVVLPGRKHLTINGADAAWTLRFGGLSATIEFVRENDPYGDEGHI